MVIVAPMSSSTAATMLGLRSTNAPKSSMTIDSLLTKMWVCPSEWAKLATIAGYGHCCSNVTSLVATGGCDKCPVRINLTVVRCLQLRDRKLRRLIII